MIIKIIIIVEQLSLLFIYQIHIQVYIKQSFGQIKLKYYTIWLSAGMMATAIIQAYLSLPQWNCSA